MSEEPAQPLKPIVRLNRRNVPSEEFIADVRRVAQLIQKETVSKADYLKQGRFSDGTLERRFGSWRAALTAAGLAHGLQQIEGDDSLFENLLDLWTKLGRQPKYSEVRRPLSRWSIKPYETRFGTWNAALVAFAQYLETEIEDNAADGSVGTPGKSSPHRTPRVPNLRLRWHVLTRDCFKCKCGRSPATDLSVSLHVDHVNPWSKGGETVLENLQTLCERCNLGKGNLDN